VKVVFAILAVVLMAPVVLVLAIALGPVAVGILCAVGFGVIVFVLANLAIGLGVWVERVGSRHMHHKPLHS
jgi:hypothetical protein